MTAISILTLEQLRSILYDTNLILSAREINRIFYAANHRWSGFQHPVKYLITFHQHGKVIMPALVHYLRNFFGDHECSSVDKTSDTVYKISFRFFFCTVWRSFNAFSSRVYL